MDREDMIEDVMSAMDRIHDMDTSWRQYATAAVDALGWRGFDTPPDRGAFIICASDKARWIDTYFIGEIPQWNGQMATRWHPVHDIPSTETA